ncbi:hypothetical protein, partial [Salmonella enterica]|uniref:hypothetical protein n=1 Tax=Salmonella enterica TaxID=28901 RepID=UPI0020C26991
AAHFSPPTRTAPSLKKVTDEHQPIPGTKIQVNHAEKKTKKNQQLDNLLRKSEHYKNKRIIISSRIYHEKKQEQ